MDMSRDPHHRAKTYPYETPGYSYVYEDARIVPLADWPEPLDELFADRTAVLAFGSNASPDQLTRKFGEFLGAVIPVTQARLQDHDVVYSAHITSYGAIPATLAPSPGTLLKTWVTWLSQPQLEHMHRTEMGSSGGAAVNYAYGQLSGLRLELPDRGDLAEAGAYLTNHGAVGFAGTPLALDQISARDRRFEAKTKLQILEAARQMLADDIALDDFIATAVADEGRRRAWTESLRLQAHALDFPNFEILERFPS